MRYLAVLLTGGVLCACTAGGVPAPVTRHITETDAGRLIELSVGDRLEVTLSSNPTTGFQWEVSHGDATVLRPVGEPKSAPAGEAVGSPGSTTLLFEAVASGETQLVLIYHRPFEKGVPAARTFEVPVRVR